MQNFSKSNFKKGITLTFATALISGFSIWLNAYGVTGINPGVFTGIKNLGVGLVLVAVILIFRQRQEVRELSGKSWIRLLMVGLVGGSVPFVLFFNGLVMTNAARAGFIQKTLFLYVALLGIWFLKERVTRYIGIGLVALLAGQVLFLQTLPRSFSLGDLMILGATLLWAIEIIIAKKTLADVSPNLVIAGRMFFGGIFIWIYLWLTGAAASAVTLTTVQWLWVAVTTLLLCGYVLTFYHGLARVPAHIATSILALGAPVTVALQAVFTNHTLSFGELAGMCIMLLSIIGILASYKKTRPDHVLQNDYR